jgi:hypothetical protein
VGWTTRDYWVSGSTRQRGSSSTDHRAAIDCVVRNLSDKGALLQVASPLGIPETFDLVCGDAMIRPCHVLWWKEKHIAVEFQR